jgi:signal transduction histidine kinase
VAILKKVADGDPSAIFPPGRKDAPDTLEESFTSIVDRLTHQKALENKLSELEHQALIAEAATHLSHEIRNPLNLIMLTAHQLGRQFAPEDEVRRANYLELIASLKEETDQLSSVVSRFIEMGRHSAPIKVLCIPSEIIGHVVIMVRQKLSEKDIVLEQSGDLDAALEADPAKLRLVFLNLIVNAIAAVPDKGKIVMHGEYDADKKRVTYSVTDNGPGIPEDDLNNIFEPYFTKREGGTGLGLALVRRIIADHDGTISVRNMPAGGACFEIVLPAGVPQP